MDERKKKVVRDRHSIFEACRLGRAKKWKSREEGRREREERRVEITWKITRGALRCDNRRKPTLVVDLRALSLFSSLLKVAFTSSLCSGPSLF